MEGLEMGVERTWEAPQDSQPGHGPPGAQEEVLGAARFSHAAEGLFCCRNSSAALLLPRLCCWHRAAGGSSRASPPSTHRPQALSSWVGGHSLDPRELQRVHHPGEG